MNCRLIGVAVILLIAATGCDDFMGIDSGDLNADDATDFVLCDAQVLIKGLPGRSLAPGVGATFTFDLNLPAGDQYRVWIWYTDYVGDGNNSYSASSPLLEPDASDVTTGSNQRPVILDTDGNLVDYATGTATEWRVEVAVWDGTDNVDYTSDTFTYEVSWIDDDGPSSSTINDVTISTDPYFDPSTATLGDTVQLIVPIENDEVVAGGYAYPVNDISNDPIDSVSLEYDAAYDAWVGTITVGQYYPTSVTFNQISFHDANWDRISFWPGIEYSANSLIITGTTPDTTAPILVSVSFEPSTAAVGSIVNVYAVFSDPESGIRENWGTNIDIGNPLGTWEGQNIDWSYDAFNARYHGSFEVIPSFPDQVIIKELWAKNGVGITTWYYEGIDFTSPILAIGS
jgi:hypothetical protein